MLPRVIASQIYTNNAALSVSDNYVPIVGPADNGPVNVPTPLTDVSVAVATFGGGPLVGAAAKAIKMGLRVLAVRTSATSVSAFGAVSRTVGSGTSVVTVDAGSATDINAVVEVLIHTGGTIGTAGITYQVSINGGLTFGAITALAAATSIVVALGAHNLTLELATGNLVSGELITVTASVIAAGTYATIDSSLYPGGANTGVASHDASTYPDNDYEILIQFTAGGTLGTAGIRYQWSTSNGRTDSDWSSEQALGTALFIIVPGTGGVKIILGVSGETIGTDSVIRQRTYAPNFSTQSVSDALTALFKNKLPWRRAILVGSVDNSMASTIDGIFAANFASTINGEKAWIGNARMPQYNETDAAYFTAMQTAFPTRNCYFGSICYGDCKMISALTGFLHRRPVAVRVGIELAMVTPNVDIARVDRPDLGVLLADENGNPDCHDEEVMPGPDDYGFITLRTQPEGVYVTNPRIFSPLGSSMEMTVHRDICNYAMGIARGYFRQQLSVDVYADSQGHIRESDARRFESECDTLEADGLRGWISGEKVTVSRTDNLLATKPPTVNVTLDIQSKIYPKLINITEKLVVSLAANG